MIGRQLALTSSAFDHKWHITTIVFDYFSHRRVSQLIFVSKATLASDLLQKFSKNNDILCSVWLILLNLLSFGSYWLCWNMIRAQEKNDSFWLRWYHCIELTITFCSTFPFCALEGAAERQCSCFCSFRHWCCLMLSFIRIIDPTQVGAAKKQFLSCSSSPSSSSPSSPSPPSTGTTGGTNCLWGRCQSPTIFTIVIVVSLFLSSCNYCCRQTLMLSMFSLKWIHG